MSLLSFFLGLFFPIRLKLFASSWLPDFVLDLRPNLLNPDDFVGSILFLRRGDFPFFGDSGGLSLGLLRRGFLSCGCTEGVARRRTASSALLGLEGDANSRVSREEIEELLLLRAPLETGRASS